MYQYLVRERAPYHVYSTTIIVLLCVCVVCSYAHGNIMTCGDMCSVLFLFLFFFVFVVFFFFFFFFLSSLTLQVNCMIVEF